MDQTTQPAAATVPVEGACKLLQDQESPHHLVVFPHASWGFYRMGKLAVRA